MRHILLTCFFVLCSTACALSSPIEIKFDQDSRDYKNTGTFTLREPVTDKVIGTYHFITGGCGRGSAPHGNYEIGRFRGHDDDRLNIGERWMIRQVGRSDGESWDPKINKLREDLELHMLHKGRVRCTLGCIGIDGGIEVWKEFQQKMRYLISWYGTLTFEFLTDYEKLNEGNIALLSRG